MFEPTSRVLHHISASYGRLGRRLIEQQSCNEERVFWRNVPAPLLRRALFAHVAVLAGKALRRLDEGRSLPWLFGRLRAAREWRKIAQHRAQTSDAGDVADWQLDDTFGSSATTFP